MNFKLSPMNARTHRSAGSAGRQTPGTRHDGSSSPQAPAAALRTRRARRVGLLAGAALVAVIGTGCFPTGPVETWVPDFNSDGAITTDEVDFEKSLIIHRTVSAIEQSRREVQAHPFLTCVRRSESDGGAYPHANGYGAQNPSSSASGAYQFIDSTWRTVSARAGHGGYSTAAQAPWFIQDAVALDLVNRGGGSAWNGTGC